MRMKFGLLLSMTVAGLAASTATAADAPAASAATSGAASDPSAYSIATAAMSTAAEASSTESGDSGWEVSVTPYAWLSAVSADISTAQGEEIEVDESFTDILGNLNFVFMGAMNARHGRFLLGTDVIYLSMSAEGEGTLGPGLVESDVDLKTLVVTALGGYRAVDQGPMFLDLFAGARITSVDVDLELSGPLQTVERESSNTRVGPVVGSRFRMPLSENWGLVLYGDVGGFGVTADLTWEAMATVQYELSSHWRLAGGWRYFHYHKDKDDFDVDLALSGPILGFTYRF